MDRTTKVFMITALVVLAFWFLIERSNNNRKSSEIQDIRREISLRIEKMEELTRSLPTAGGGPVTMNDLRMLSEITAAQVRIAQLQSKADLVRERREPALPEFFPILLFLLVFAQLGRLKKESQQAAGADTAGRGSALP